MDWNDLKFFLAVAHGKTLSSAATQLGVSPSTVSRRIEMLEHALNVQLFRPHQSGYDLTPTGRKVTAIAEQAGAQMQVFQRIAQELNSNNSGPVSIEAPELLGQEVILPSLVNLMQRHPEIRIKLRSSVHPVRLVGEEADIVLRIVRPEKGPYKIRKVGEIKFHFYASKSYVEKHGVPATPDDLKQHRVIGWSEELHYLSMARWLELICPGLQPSLRLTSLNAQIAAVKQGFGWAILPSFAAESAKLTPCLFDSSVLNSGLWLLLHQQSTALQRVLTVRDHLIQTMSQLDF